ncbi:nuclear transport factor 2 family protein [Nonomuraea sediminis]|uniref:nuclear transport factor 2 family protein n=1 Tax=Nonomuraea sediminis TaxID=2835864 RepID=UPI001BDCF66F|nr:nuclear transport factor 2 family protein [Nonomuraea sediminis]
MSEQHDVLQRYLRAGVDGDRAARSALFGDDAVVEFPFAPEGSQRRFAGRQEIEAMFDLIGDTARAGDIRIDEAATSLTVHETTDPEVLIAESEVHVDTPAGRLRLPYIQVFRIREGKIVLFRDYFGPRTGELTKALFSR